MSSSSRVTSSRSSDLRAPPTVVFVCGTPGVGKTSFSKELAAKFPGAQHLEISRLVEQFQLTTGEFDRGRNCSVFDEEKVADHLSEVLFRDDAENLQEDHFQQVASTSTSSSKIFVIDFHSCCFVDLVETSKEESRRKGGSKPNLLPIVLRASTEQLATRLEGRGYSQEKIRENIEAEIFQVVLEEAEETFSSNRGSGIDPRDDGDDHDQSMSDCSFSSDEEKADVFKLDHWWNVSGVVELENNSVEQMEQNLEKATALIQAVIDRQSASLAGGAGAGLLGGA
eukprot:g8645.t1